MAKMINPQIGEQVADFAWRVPGGFLHELVKRIINKNSNHRGSGSL